MDRIPLRRPEPVVTPTILDAIDHPELWRSWFKDPATWAPWRTFLSVLFGLPLTEADLVLYRECTARTAPPSNGFSEAWLICGRRAGKSFTLALIVSYLATFVDWSEYLIPGESAAIRIIAVDRRQARVIHQYIRALLSRVPALAHQVKRSDDEVIELENGLTIEIATANFRTLRGYTLVALCGDECAYWRNEDTAANPDREILTAARAAQATLHGRGVLLLAGSPYAKRGEQYEAYKRYYGRNNAPVLVWKAPTRTMNSTVPQSFIDAEYERDPEAAAAEFGAEFRSDIGDYIPREVVDAAVVPDRTELPPVPGVDYVGAVDVSGGSVDSMTLAIAHAGPDGTVVLDAVREVRPPFSPEAVTQEYAQLLRTYGVSRLVGDRYGGLWPVEAFGRYGISYEPAEQSKSEFYRDLLPLLTSQKTELLDVPRLIGQIAGLERRTARGGKDSIDHPPGAHDDLANAAAIALVQAALIAQPTLWRAEALLKDGHGSPWPRPADAVFVSASADESGLFWCLWARDMTYGGDPLALIDFGREPFSRECVVTLAKRIVVEANLAHARDRSLLAPAALAGAIASVITEAAMDAYGTNPASLDDFAIAIRDEDANDVDALLTDRDKLLLSGASAIGAGKVKLCHSAVERGKSLPSPLAGLRPGAPASAATDAALIALAVTFSEPPERPRKRMGGRN